MNDQSWCSFFAVRSYISFLVKSTAFWYKGKIQLIQFLLKSRTKKKRDYSEEWIVPSPVLVASRVDLFCDTRSGTFPVKREHYSKNSIKLIFLKKNYCWFSSMKKI